MAAIVFDLDNTLYPQVRFVHSGFGAVARAIAGRFDLDAADVYRRLRTAHDGADRGVELQALCAWFGLTDALVPELVQVIRSHEPQIWLSHDVRDVLTTLRHRGWRIALLTNGLPSTQAAKVRALGLTDLVDHIVYAEQHAPAGKPAPEPFLATLSRLEVAPQSAVMVGDDRINDIEGARAVGMRTILLSRSATSRDANADAVVGKLADVLHVALGLTQNGMAHAA
jgi:putative hydrolase of the HAD superfamily